MKIIRLMIQQLRRLLSGEVYYVNGSDTLPPPLTRQEEAEVFVRLSSDPEARKTLIVHNLRLVVYIAKKFESTGIGIEDLGTVADEPFVFLFSFHHKAGGIRQRENRNIVAVTVLDETCCLVCGIAVNRTVVAKGLVCHDTNGDTAERTKTDYDIFCKFFVYFQESGVIQ